MPAAGSRRSVLIFTLERRLPGVWTGGVPRRPPITVTSLLGLRHPERAQRGGIFGWFEETLQSHGSLECRRLEAAGSGGRMPPLHFKLDQDQSDALQQHVTDHRVTGRRRPTAIVPEKRTVKFAESEMNTTPCASIAIPAGRLNCASLPEPSSQPGTPAFPATMLTT